jgi:hypothetical protein
MFLALVSGALATPLVVEAQQVGKTRRIGVLADEPWAALDGR